MEDISILQLLYIVLIVFWIILWTMLSIILWKLNNVLKVFTEVSKGYFNVKNMAMNYSSVPKELGKKFMWIVQEELNKEEVTEKKSKKKTI